MKKYWEHKPKTFTNRSLENVIKIFTDMLHKHFKGINKYTYST